MRLLEPGDVRTADRTEPCHLRPARHEPRRRRSTPDRPSRRVLRAARERWMRHDRGRGRERARVGLALRAGAARRTVPRRLGVDRRRLPSARRARHRVARPRRRAGIVGVPPTSAVGAIARARGQHARGPEVDGGRRHRRRRRRVRERRQARRRRRLRRCRDQRRTAQPRPPVPQRAHEPARRRMGSRSQPVRETGDRGGPSERSPTASSGCGCRATSSRRGPASRPSRRRRSPPISSPPASTTSSSCAARSTPPRRPDPTSTNRPGFNIELCRTIRAEMIRRVDVPVVLQGSVVDIGQAEWALGDDGDRAAVCDAVEMTRAQIADPDLVAKVGAWRRRRDQAVYPVQPDVPGPRRAQPDRHVHR